MLFKLPFNLEIPIILMARIVYENMLPLSVERKVFRIYQTIVTLNKLSKLY